MPFYLDFEQRRVGWEGSTYLDNPTNSLIAYRLRGTNRDGGVDVIYIEPEFHSENYYNEAKTTFSFVAVIDLLPTEANETYENLVKITKVESADVYGLDWGHWGGVPVISFRTPLGRRGNLVTAWSPDRIVERFYLISRDEAKEEFEKRKVRG